MLYSKLIFADTNILTNHKGHCVFCRCCFSEHNENKAAKLLFSRPTKFVKNVLKHCFGDEVGIKYPLAIQTECSAILCEFKGCIKYALLQIQIRGENPNTQIAESVSPPHQHIYEMHCFAPPRRDILHFIPFHIARYFISFHHVSVQHCNAS